MFKKTIAALLAIALSDAKESKRTAYLNASTTKQIPLRYLKKSQMTLMQSHYI